KSLSLEEEGHDDSTPGAIGHGNGPAMQLDQFSGHGQAEPHSLPGRFRAEKWLEHLVEVTGAHAGAVILHAHLDHAFSFTKAGPGPIAGLEIDLLRTERPRGGEDRQPASVGHGVE